MNAQIRQHIKELENILKNIKANDEQEQINFERLKFAEQLQEGIEVKLSEVQIIKGLLSFKGHQVLLYIPDHTTKYHPPLYALAREAQKCNRFHIANCEKLEEMRQNGRYNRYIATTDISGRFKITGKDSYGNTTKEKVTLNVCKYCLAFIDYQGYKQAQPDAKQNIFNRFNIEEFLSSFSTYFQNLPRHTSPYKTDYTTSWERISDSYRKSVDYTCESCGANLTQHRHLLHVHHLNGIKGDNAYSNLKALCTLCHQAQPYHNHIKVSRKDKEIIMRERRIHNIPVVDMGDEEIPF